ncbi:GntR family transcriptional regulator [Variovorax ginsengisoli]|uniref:DNA-binding GntR family transcriptional regulator n=1 Tax=Variovorax ginsengisoli TaxID=363844 RepID=A0ABT9S605_9BURK|nr:GntR family transcriptional regulator [Variovorax ginsengisoli]MDP9899283.1 DNA-binding GntR family transcriptional regulator [Variovorax ginsengisoli]
MNVVKISTRASSAKAPLKAMRLQPTNSLATQVAVRLRQAIIEGELALGALIPEEALAESFGVSRTPVREAINQLQLQGLVYVRPQVGSFVFRPSADDVAALCQFRCVIEPKAAELAYSNAKFATVEAMEQSIESMESALARHDTVSYGHADTALHDALFENCGNVYLQEAYRLAAGKIAALRTNLSAPLDVERPESFEEHKKFVRLFIKGDLAAFAALVVEHVRGSGKAYVHALRSDHDEDLAHALARLSDL